MTKISARLFALAAMLMAISPAHAQLSAPAQLNTNNIARPSYTNGGTADARKGPSAAVDAAGNASIAWAAWVQEPVTLRNYYEVWNASVSTAGAVQSGLVAPESFVVTDAQIRTDAAGNSTAVWIGSVESTIVPGTIGRNVLLAADKPLGGNWSAPTEIAVAGPIVTRPFFSMNSRGDALLALPDTVGGVKSVSFAKRIAGTAWTALAPLASMADTVDASTVGVAPTQAVIGENGDALVSWYGYRVYCLRSACRPVAVEVHVAQQANGATHWVKSGKVANTNQGFFVLDKQGRAGQVSTTFATNGATTTMFIRASTQLGIGQPWSAPIDIYSSVGGSLSGLVGGGDDAGNVTVVFSDPAAGANTMSLTGNVATNAWSTPQVIAGFGALDSVNNTVSFSVGHNGAAVLANRDVAVIRPGATAPWGGVATLAPGGTGARGLGAEAVAINANGKAVIVFWKFDAVALTYHLFAVSGTNTGAAPPPILPAAPSGMTAAVSVSGQIDLAWIDNAGAANETAQSLERCAGVGCGNFVQLGALIPGLTRFSDAGLAPSTSYSYRIRALGSAGNSPYSNVATATTPVAATVPAAPGSLSSTAVTRNSVDLFWLDNSNNELNFVLERCRGQGCTSFAQIATPAANATSHASSGLRSNTSYSFHVRAVNAIGSSANSNVLTVKTLP